ncbi:hypothetical protein ACSBR1_038259 [Camellia fascicularis]
MEDVGGSLASSAPPYMEESRHAILLVINMVKSQASMPWDWNPFGLDSHLNWSKFSLLVVLCTPFSFTSIRVPLACPLNLWHIHSFVQWAKATLSAVPDLNVFISATETHGANLEQEHYYKLCLKKVFIGKKLKNT